MGIIYNTGKKCGLFKPHLEEKINDNKRRITFPPHNLLNIMSNSKEEEEQQKAGILLISK